MSDSSSGRGSAWLRAVDRYAGVPLVALLGLRTKRRHLPPLRSLGLLQTAAIGDTVLMSGILRDLRRSLPEARIVLFAGSSNYGMARLLDGADEIVELPVGNPFRAIRMLRARKLDVLCDFGPWPRLNAICSALSGARFLIGFRTPGEYRQYVYDRAVEHSPCRHELENQRALVRALGVESDSMPHLSADTPLPPGLGPKTYVVFHAWPAGYRAYLKEWPPIYWLDLAERLAPFGYDIVLTGGPSDRERTAALFSRLKSRSGRKVLDLAGETTLAATIRVLKDATAVVSVNTGIVHLAAAVGTPVISLNGPTNGARWGPVGPASVSVNAAGHDCGYLNLGFEYAGHREDCMATIQPERVYQALLRSLGSELALKPSRNSKA